MLMLKYSTFENNFDIYRTEQYYSQFIRMFFWYCKELLKYGDMGTNDMLREIKVDL